MKHQLLWRPAAQGLRHIYAQRVVIVQPGYKLFFMSNFADGKNVSFTIRILSRLTLSITVTETVVKAQRSLWWVTETMEVEGGSHWGLAILLSARTSSTKVPTVITQLSQAQ